RVAAHVEPPGEKRRYESVSFRAGLSRVGGRSASQVLAQAPDGHGRTDASRGCVGDRHVFSGGLREPQSFRECVSPDVWRDTLTAASRAISCPPTDVWRRPKRWQVA